MNIETQRDAALAGYYVRKFAQNILHGDDDHMRWLLEEANKYSSDLVLEVKSDVRTD